MSEKRRDKRSGFFATERANAKMDGMRTSITTMLECSVRVQLEAGKR